MRLKKRDFQPGDVTDQVWSGDCVTHCEFIRELERGGLLFWNQRDKVFHRAYWERIDGSFILNGWECSDKPFRS